MANPLLKDLKSVLVFEETNSITSQFAPALNQDRQITASAVTQTVITSADLNNSNNHDYVWNVLEALDGNVKRQMVLVKGFNQATDNATVTQFFEASPNATMFRNWNLPFPIATCTSNSTNAEVVSTYRTEADDYWNNYKMFCIKGTNNSGNLVNINDFTASSDAFTVDAMSGISVLGDAYLPVVPIQPSDVEIAISGGKSIEREIITDTLDPEGIVVGAQEEVSMTIKPEIRPLATGAGNGTQAGRPAESFVFLKTVFTENRDTGDIVDTTNGTTNTTQMVMQEGTTTFTRYNLAMVNGDVFAIGTLTNSSPAAGDSLISAIPAGHLSQAPANGDVVYAGCCYRPKDSGHQSIGCLAYMGDRELAVLTGGMPEVGFEIGANEIAKWSFKYNFAGGFLCTETKAHQDIYDTTAPLVGRANVSRVVLGGSELDGDVMSLSGTLLPGPQRKGAAFQAFENNGGYFYSSRAGQIEMVVYLENSDYWQKYRYQSEFDLLIQVGSTPAGAWALWAPRAQLVGSPEMGDEGGLMTWKLSFRLLRPTTAGKPAYVIGMF